MEMSKVYEPKAFETELYDWWEKEGFFRAEPDPDKKPFTILMPPPNITGQLHMGHALDNSVQDCLIRWKRMQGYSALWLPGTDHASIATEVKVTEELKKRGIEKAEIGRDSFLRYCWEWKEKYGGRIVKQLKRLGASCDWSRLAFTLDEPRSKAVRRVFCDLYRKGLIYQGNRITNWCPECKTALSDAEVEYVEKASHLWYFRYDAPDKSYSVTFATTRPETMLGDTAVAVNPADERYRELIGKTVVVPFVDREIPIIADDYVEKDFGTGVVKITPAHDPNDFEVGVRHQLPFLHIMDESGKLNENGGEFAGMDRYEARKKIVEAMQTRGQLVKIEDYTHNVGECYRCHTVIEPMVTKQWYVRMQELARPALEAVKKGDLKFIPKRFEKIYFNWMENIRDWCISRQLWWGHRIPVYDCLDCGERICSEEIPNKCPKCGGERLHQEEDVLDTWFSSALWPFSTLGYPEQTEDLNYFFPTDVLVTAYDIIFFWVARMIFSTLEHMGELPFRDVLIHGIVRDAEGRKMSKSLGNGIDPLEVIDRYGADSLRFSLLNGVSNGSDIRYSEEKLEGTRNFMNKIWNASRFVRMNSEEKKIPDWRGRELSAADRFILHELNRTAKEVGENLEKYELGLASQKLYDFMWSEFCDWYIEFSKPVLYGTDEEKRLTTLSVLNYVLKQTLELLHPFIPFITEKIYQEFGFGRTIMTEPYPVFDASNEFRSDYETMNDLKEIIVKIRNARKEMDVAPSRRIRLLIKTDRKKELENVFVYLQKMAGAESISFVEETPEKSVSLICTAGEVYIPLGDLVDVEKEIVRLKKELENARQEFQRAEGKLRNDGFLNKAPRQLIEAERGKAEEYAEKIRKLTVRIAEWEKF